VIHESREQALVQRDRATLSGIGFALTDDEEPLLQIDLYPCEVLDLCISHSGIERKLDDQAGGKVLTVHSRRAAPDVIALLSGIKARVILHWFTGSRRELENAAGRGFFFSVNSAMLRSEKGRALIVRMPRERVLTETDGPFIRDGDHPATPPTVRTTIGSLAKLWHAKPEDVQASVLGNLRYILT
jgi:Tat protein secretion system quality control protein TatD with DNase activity